MAKSCKVTADKQNTVLMSFGLYIVKVLRIETDIYIYIHTYIYMYVIVISQCEYDILVITRVRGGAEDEC